MFSCHDSRHDSRAIACIDANAVLCADSSLFSLVAAWQTKWVFTSLKRGKAAAVSANKEGHLCLSSLLPTFACLE